MMMVELRTSWNLILLYHVRQVLYPTADMLWTNSLCQANFKYDLHISNSLSIYNILKTTAPTILVLHSLCQLIVWTLSFYMKFKANPLKFLNNIYNCSGPKLIASIDTLATVTRILYISSTLLIYGEISFSSL